MTASAEHVIAIPPRFRWSKRIITSYAVVLVLLVAGRWGWGDLAHRKLHAAMDELRERGVPMMPEDTHRSTFDTETNAGYWIQRALDSIDRTKIAGYMYTDGNAGVARTNWQSLKAEAPFYDDARRCLRRASQLPPGYWPAPKKLPPGSLWISPTIQHLEIAELAQLLRTDAIISFLEGKHEEACLSVLDMITLARTIDLENTSSLSYSFSLRIETSAIRLIEDILPWLQIDVRQAEDHTIPARKETVQKLIDRLLNNDANGRFRQMLYAERAFGLRWTQDWMEGRGQFPAAGSPILPRLIFRPYLEHKQLEWLLDTGNIVAAAESPTWRQAVDMMPPAPGDVRSGVFGLGYLLPFGPNDETIILRNRYLYKASCRLAATALALRLYECDHAPSPEIADELPESLDVLTSSVGHGPWLAEIPVDPFADRVQRIRYLPSGEYPALYSLSVNGIDDGGTPPHAGGEYSEGDLVFELTGHADAEPFATRPLNSNE